MPGPVSDLVLGLRLVGRATAMVLGTRRLLLLGALPALVTSVLYVGALVLVATYLDTLAALVTGFADGWSPGLRDAVRVAAAVAIAVAAGAIGVVTFVAVTLVIGGPFYDRLAELVDDAVGPVRGEVADRGWLRPVLRGARDGLVLIGMSVLAAVPLFVAGFVPVVGQTVVPLAAALVGGRLLMIELSAAAFERRSVGFVERRRALRSRRVLTATVGVPVSVLAAIPLVAIVAVPIGAAAATLLARAVRGEPTEVAPASRRT